MATCNDNHVCIELANNFYTTNIRLNHIRENDIWDYIIGNDITLTHTDGHQNPYDII